MKGMVIVHKVAVTTLITLAYSGWLSNSEAMLTQVVAEGVAVAKSVISKIVSPSGEKLAKPLYFKNTKTISGITMRRKKATRGTRLYDLIFSQLILPKSIPAIIMAEGPITRPKA